MIKLEKFKGHDKARANIIVETNDTTTTYTLISYTTNIIRVVVSEYLIKIEPLTTTTHSNTTRKHIAQFANYINDKLGTHYNYYTFKESIEKSLCKYKSIYERW